MVRKVFKDGDIFYAADANNAGNPILDAADYYGHGTKVIDSWLDDGANSIKARFYNWFNRFLVTVSSGLTLAVTGGVAVKSGGSVINIAPQNITVPNNSVTYVYIGSVTSDPTIMLRTSNNLPTNSLPLAKVISINNNVTSLQDLRDPSSSIIPADAPQVIFPGFIIMSFQNINVPVPSGYFECNGQAISRFDYSSLFTMIGTTYGVGDDSSTFNLPDTRDRFLLSYNTSVNPVGHVGGSFQQILTGDNLPSHTHDTNDPGHLHQINQLPHVHSVQDQGHTHHLNDPGHLHHWEYTMCGLDTLVGIYPANGNTQVGETIMSNNTFVNVTGVTAQINQTGITIDPEYADVGTFGSDTGVSVRSTGNSAPLTTTPPYMVVRCFIKY